MFNIYKYIKYLIFHTREIYLNTQDSFHAFFSLLLSFIYIIAKQSVITIYFALLFWDHHGYGHMIVDFWVTMDVDIMIVDYWVTMDVDI